MKIIFDEKPGHIYDVFKSLWILNNLEKNEEIKNEYGISSKNIFEDALIVDSSEWNFSEEGLKRYFYEEETTEKIIGIREIWNSKNIEDYVNYLRGLEGDIHIKRTYEILNAILGSESLDESLKLEDMKENVLAMIMEEDISSGLKWEVYMLLNDSEKYVNEYMDFIEDYLKYFNKIDKERIETLESYNKNLKEGLEAKGLDFLKEQIGNIYDFKDVKEIRVTTTALAGLRIFAEGDICYVIMGPYLLESLKNLKEDDDKDNIRQLVRDIAEPTRYLILQILLERDCYGQELVDKLGLNKTTVFYHIDYLVGINVIKLSRVSRKNYYSVNREKVIASIDKFKATF